MYSNYEDNELVTKTVSHYKLNRVLNALYAAFTERKGVEPMSQQVFKERKNIINQQALAAL